jgi:hypothetical protein
MTKACYKRGSGVLGSRMEKHPSGQAVQFFYQTSLYLDPDIACTGQAETVSLLGKAGK